MVLKFEDDSLEEAYGLYQSTTAFPTDILFSALGSLVWWLSLAATYNQLSPAEKALVFIRLLTGLLPIVLILSAPKWYQRHRDSVVVFLRLNTMLAAYVAWDKIFLTKDYFTWASFFKVMVLANKWPFLGCLVVGFWVRFWICLPVHTLCLAVQLASNKNCCTVMTGRKGSGALMQRLAGGWNNGVLRGAGSFLETDDWHACVATGILIQTLFGHLLPLMSAHGVEIRLRKSFLRLKHRRSSLWAKPDILQVLPILIGMPVAILLAWPNYESDAALEPCQ